MFQHFGLSFLDNSLNFDCWQECVDVQQEMKAVVLLDGWLLDLQVGNQDIVLLANGGQMKVNRHPSLQNARQMSFFNNTIVD